MDDLFRVPVLGWRFGLDALIGLVPGLGDTATSLVSFYILAAAVRYRVPKITLLRMGLNIGLDYVVGSLPVVGDVADAWWKSNRKNVELLQKRATVSAEEARTGRASDWLFVGGIDCGTNGTGRSQCLRQHLSCLPPRQDHLRPVNPLFFCDWFG